MNIFLLILIFLFLGYCVYAADPTSSSTLFTHNFTVSPEKYFGCKDFEGRNADQSLSIILANGKGFVNIDDHSTTFQFYANINTEKTSPEFHNIKQENSEEFLQIFWNEAFKGTDNKGTTASDKAHAKGYVLFDFESGTGVFVMHSVPYYGSKSSAGKMPSNVEKNSQYISCVTIDEDGLNTTQERRAGGILCQERQEWHTALLEMFTYTTVAEEREKNKTKP